jgi:CHAT domain-containing protein
LVIELDDGLAGLPVEALLDSQNQYLGDRNPIVSSLGIYYQGNLRLSTPITTNSAALVAAVPISAVSNDPSVPLLPDVVLEGAMVAHSFHSAKLLTGKEATAAAVLSNLPNASVFHFAGHGISSSEETGILLSDSLLSAPALTQASLSGIQLVVFSACDTQEGSSSGVYGVNSLVRTFLQAGVPHVVVSRWNVDSSATREFMDLFYRALFNGNSPARSIQLAQVGLRSEPRMRHPYYWSAFTTYGNL